MSKRVVTFERARLFDEVWAEPLTKVAKRYGVEAADVRAATVIMDVPRPSSGHWTQVEYGKARPKPELPESGAPTTYELALDDAEEGAVRPLRLAKSTTVASDRTVAPAPVVSPPPVTPSTAEVAPKVEALPSAPQPTVSAEAGSPPAAPITLSLPPLATSIDQCLPLVRTMWARLKKAYLDQRKFPAIRGNGIFDMAVSSGNQLRGLLALDRALRHCKAAGLKLVADEASKKPAFVALEGQELTLRLFESGRQVPNELTAAERAKLKLNPNAYLYRDKYVFEPTNIIKLEVRVVRHDWLRFSVVETKRRPLAECLGNFADLLQTEAVRLRLKDEEREASSKRHAAAEALRSGQRAHRKAELEKLERFEDMANRLLRARRLRELAAVLDGPGALQGDDRDGQLRWLTEAADWLDPIVRRPWPEVDDVDPRPY